ncbi:hypothetical protein AOY92_19235 [Escherichia coli]|nr:hypothetical protein AOY92_19235 [Escherichia coli]
MTSLNDMVLYPVINGFKKSIDLLFVDVPLARMVCELDCQQTRPVVHCLLNKTQERPRFRQGYFCRN